MADHPEVKRLLAGRNAPLPLSRLEQTILEDYLAGLYYKEIANKRRVKFKTVDNAITRIKRKLRQEAS